MEQSKLVGRLEGYRRRNSADHCYLETILLERINDERKRTGLLL